MANIKADAMVLAPSSEVGEIDTRAPFQSVRDALSLFRQVTFKKQQPPPSLSSSSSSSSSKDATTTDALDKEKETQLLLAEKEFDRVKLSLDGSLKAKAIALSDLDSAQRKANDLKARIEATKQSKEHAVLTKSTMNQRLEERKSEKEETERARESYILVTAELFMAKQELAELKQEFGLSVEERVVELQRAEEAESTSTANSNKIKEMSKDIAEMIAFAERLKSEAARKNEEAEKINEDRISANETYASMKKEAEERLEDVRRDCNPELQRDIDELAEISAENEVLQEKIRLVCELKDAKSAMQELCAEESSSRSLVDSLTVELDVVQRENRDVKENEKERREVEEEASRKVEETMSEAEKIRREAEEMMQKAEELRSEASDRHLVMGEATKQLELVKRAVAKAKTAEKRAVEDMRILTERQGSVSNDETEKKVRISLHEYEDLRGKHEESERMVELKAKTVDSQLEEINKSRVDAESMLEEKIKEKEEIESGIDGALRKAEIAEEAHSIVDAELRKWRPEDL